MCIVLLVSAVETDMHCYHPVPSIVIGFAMPLPSLHTTCSLDLGNSRRISSDVFEPFLVRVSDTIKSRHSVAARKLPTISISVLLRPMGRSLISKHAGFLQT